MVITVAVKWLGITGSDGASANTAGGMMSNSKSLGPSVGLAAALPVTGANTLGLVLAGLAVLVVGLLLMRATRVRKVRV